jgi:hypothetical protein
MVVSIKRVNYNVDAVSEEAAGICSLKIVVVTIHVSSSSLRYWLGGLPLSNPSQSYFMDGIRLLSVIAIKHLDKNMLVLAT